MKKIFPFLLLGLVLLTHQVYAIAKAPITPPTGPISIGGGTVAGVVCLGLQWLFTGAILFSIILALVAAYEYMRSSGEPAKVTAATNRLIFVAIGVAVAILARTLPVLVGSLFNASASGDTSSFCTK